MASPTIRTALEAAGFKEERAGNWVKSDYMLLCSGDSFYLLALTSNWSVFTDDLNLALKFMECTNATTK